MYIILYINKTYKINKRMKKKYCNGHIRWQQLLWFPVYITVSNSVCSRVVHLNSNVQPITTMS